MGSIENLFPQYNAMIRTSMFPFHSPLVIKSYNFLAYFSQAQLSVFGILWVLLKIFYFQYNAMIRTSMFPFHSPLVIKNYNFLAYFSLDYENCLFTKFC